MNTPIVNMQHDKLIQIPSTSGEFSTHSAYNMITLHWCHSPSVIPNHNWKTLWSANLHVGILSSSGNSSAIPSRCSIGYTTSSRIWTLSATCVVFKMKAQFTWLSNTLSYNLYGGIHHGKFGQSLFNIFSSTSGSDCCLVVTTASHWMMPKNGKCNTPLLLPWSPSEGSVTKFGLVNLFHRGMISLNLSTPVFPTISQLVNPDLPRANPERCPPSGDFHRLVF